MEEILKYTGIGGLALSVFFLLFRDIIKKNIFPALSQQHSYQIIKLIIFLIFAISLISIVGYFYINYNGSSSSIEKGDSTLTVKGNTTIVGNNNTSISGSNNSINNFNQGVPFYENTEFTQTPYSDFSDFIAENNGKEVMINVQMEDNSDAKFFTNSYDTSSTVYSKQSIQVNSVQKLRETEDFVGGDIGSLEFTPLHRSTVKYLVNFGEGEVAYLYYRNKYPLVKCKIIINEMNKSYVYWDHTSIFIKGKYYIDNREYPEYNFATFTPK